MENGADLEKKAAFKMRALHVAATYGYLDIVEGY